MDSERQTDAGALDDNKLMNMVRDSGNGLGSDSRHGSPFLKWYEIVRHPAGDIREVLTKGERQHILTLGITPEFPILQVRFSI